MIHHVQVAGEIRLESKPDARVFLKDESGIDDPPRPSVSVLEREFHPVGALAERFGLTRGGEGRGARESDN
jgi:hypothetical protein